MVANAIWTVLWIAYRYQKLLDEGGIRKLGDGKMICLK